MKCLITWETLPMISKDNGFKGKKSNLFLRNFNINSHLFADNAKPCNSLSYIVLINLQKGNSLKKIPQNKIKNSLIWFSQNNSSNPNPKVAAGKTQTRKPINIKFIASENSMKKIVTIYSFQPKILKILTQVPTNDIMLIELLSSLSIEIITSMYLFFLYFDIFSQNLRLFSYHWLCFCLEILAFVFLRASANLEFSLSAFSNSPFCCIRTNDFLCPCCWFFTFFYLIAYKRSNSFAFSSSIFLCSGGLWWMVTNELLDRLK